jgi:hypothetical protein
VERGEPFRAATLEVRAPEADALARELAAATGEDIEAAVVRAIEDGAQWDEHPR